tara:strand:+ start:53 stop:913 length:861 start_codon:yes stop_codon:yes gene_type:complete
LKGFPLSNENNMLVSLVDSNELALHEHSFFELIYVLDGVGVWVINNKPYTYQKGSMFLLTKEDMCQFDGKQVSSFLMIGITQDYFKRSVKPVELVAQTKDLFRTLENMVSGKVSSGDSLSLGFKTKSLVDILVHQLIDEIESPSFYSELVRTNIIYLLLSLIARDFKNSSISKNGNKKKVDEIRDIIAYVQRNIYNKDELSLERIALHFCKSKDYISQYFKKETGEPLKSHILQYKIGLVKKRLLNSDLTILDIANELNFSDESHLNRLFKKRCGMTAKEYRTINR